MARFSSGATSRLGKRCRNASETASLSSWGSEVNVHSDAEDNCSVFQNQIPAKKRRSGDSGVSPDPKDFTSSDDETRPSNSSASGGTRGRKPKCFSRNAVLARENRLKKKKYIGDLENELQSLRRENSKLKVSLSGYTKDVELVRKENVYLRNVLANSKQLSQLLRSINVNCGLPSATIPKPVVDLKRPAAAEKTATQSKVIVESVVPAAPALAPCDTDSCVPSSSLVLGDATAARTMRKGLPIAADDVSLSSSAPEDEDDDDLDLLFGSKNVPLDLDFNLNEASLDDPDYLGFGPNAFGDWLDGDEPLANVGVCLHVAKNKVSLEFCSSCNENALSSWSGIAV
ncbi:uncharacterized protein LOC117645217 [Thrips palmi]|uniref:Uncharacterized protein LOC117645217 n=1 Tax=Thrips palmi TaxID=161013 RepID=A0A6P8Z3H7_THRPL|nr:uncharacterized protein LOC117645217 [Thrips palmi]